MRLSVSRNVLLTLVVITIIVFAEIFCRIILGLGDPPIYITDTSIEYLLKPNQSLKRFGNHVFVNNWGMRSLNFSQKKQNSNECVSVALEKNLIMCFLVTCCINISILYNNKPLFSVL